MTLAAVTFVQQRFLYAQRDSQMKRKRNQNNVVIIIIVSYVTVFLLYSLQDKIWHIVMSCSVSMYRRSVLVLPSPMQEKGSFRDAFPLPCILVSFCKDPAQLKGPEASRSKNRVKYHVLLLLNSSFVSQKKILCLSSCPPKAVFTWC